MKKFGAILLALTAILTSLSLVGCKGPMTDADAVEILTPLLERDVELNRYVWGDGFTTRETPKEEEKISDICQYYRVSEDAPYHNTAALRADIEEVYSTILAAAICDYAFVNTGDTMARFCDFKQNNQIADLQIDITLNHPPYKLDAVMYPDTAVVIRSTTTIIEAELEYSIGKDGERKTMEIRVLKQDGKWKLDTHTWAGAIG